MPIRALIVDDEPFSRLKIRDFLGQEADIDIVGEAGDGSEAVRIIRKQKPDLVFLDVQMPELDGFGVVEAVGLENMPYVIFATAYDQYALRAFEIHALDYLLKPFDRERFHEALEHARKYIGMARTNEEFKDRIKNLLLEIQSETPFLKRFLIQTKKRIYFLRAEEVERIESAGNYVTLHAESGGHLLRETLTDLEHKLAPQTFVRANRSNIINLEFIKEIQPYFHGEYIVVLKSDQKVVLSRNYRENFKKVFRGRF
jgi:two-component system LytT family response regulator